MEFINISNLSEHKQKWVSLIAKKVKNEVNY